MDRIRSSRQRHISGGFLVRLAHHQRDPGSLHNGGTILVNHAENQFYRTSAQAGQGLSLGDFHLEVHGIADKDRSAEFPVFDLSKGDDGALHQPGPYCQAGSDGQDQKAMSNPLAKWRFCSIYSVGVDRIEITRYPGEAQDIGFGDGPARA